MSKMRNRDNEEPSYSFDPYLADATSVRDAIIVRQIQHKLAEYRVLAKYHAKQMVYIDGKLAVPLTAWRMRKLNPFWSVYQIARCLQSLKHHHILISERARSMMRISYYVIDNYQVSRYITKGKQSFKTQEHSMHQYMHY